MPKAKTVHQEAMDTHIASPKVNTALANFFLTVFLPILPGLITTLAPKIASNTKLVAVLKATRDAINGILGE